MYVFQDKNYIRLDNEKEAREYFSKDGWSKDKKSWFPFDLRVVNMSFPLFLQRDNSPDVLATVGNAYLPMKESQLKSLKQEYNELRKLFNEPSAVTELEEIKSEINAKERVELSTKEMWYNFALADVTHIIDNRIAELKGENNANTD